MNWKQREILGVPISALWTAAIFAAPLVVAFDGVPRAPTFELPHLPEPTVVTIALDGLFDEDGVDADRAEEDGDTREEAGHLAGEDGHDAAPAAQAPASPSVDAAPTAREVAPAPPPEAPVAAERAPEPADPAPSKPAAAPADLQVAFEAPTVVRRPAADAVAVATPASRPLPKTATADLDPREALVRKAAEIGPLQALRESAVELAGKPMPIRRKCSDPHEDVHPQPDGSVLIDRDLIEYYTASIDRFNTLGYSRKHKGDDGSKGWLIGGFGCHSPLFKAGLRSRDIVQTVNGKKTNNVVQILFLWAGMKGKEDFEVVVLRRGEEKTLRFHVPKPERTRRGR